MSAVTILQCPIVTGLDPARLQRIFDVLGDDRAERAICRTLGQMATQLNRMQIECEARRLDDLRSSAQRLAALSRSLGLTEVEEASMHVRTCARQGDGIALEAVMARLERGFDVAIGQVWDGRFA